MIPYVCLFFSCLGKAKKYLMPQISDRERNVKSQLGFQVVDAKLTKSVLS